MGSASAHRGLGVKRINAGSWGGKVFFFSFSSFFYKSEAQFLCCLPSCSLLGADVWQGYLAQLHLLL